VTAVRAILGQAVAVLQQLLKFNERSTRFQRALKSMRRVGAVQGEVMSKLFIRSVQACAAAAAAMCAVPAVLAQEAPARTGVTAGGLEEITVTARRREESLQDVPIAVTAFSADRIEDAGALDITWLQQSTPNLTFQVARATNSTLIAFIRGIGQQDPLWGFEPGVGLYVDDVYVARPQGAVLDIYDIERLEVLRGPQGTLYGRNTIGGAVKYVTRRLGDTARLDTKVNLGSYGQTDFIASGTLPLGETFAVGASAAIYRRDGYGTNLYSKEDHYAKDVDAFRVSAEWQPSDAVSVRRRQLAGQAWASGGAGAGSDGRRGRAQGHLRHPRRHRRRQQRHHQGRGAHHRLAPERRAHAALDHRLP